MCSRGGQELGKPDQVVGGHREGELPADAVEPAMSGLAEAGRGLGPAEGLLDALSDDLTDLVAGMAGDRQQEEVLGKDDPILFFVP